MTNIHFFDMVYQLDQTSNGRETVDFSALFRPKTLAVIGVSLTHERHPANVIYHKNNLRQRVKVFPVNARGGVLQGEPLYPRLSDVPEPVDLAVVATRA
jgi:predicted CoA-binding protein